MNSKKQIYKHLTFITLSSILLIILSYTPYFYWNSDALNNKTQEYLEENYSFLQSTYETSSTPKQWVEKVLNKRSDIIQIFKYQTENNPQDNFYLIAREKSFNFPKTNETWTARIKIAQIFHHESDYGQNYYYFCPSFNQPHNVSVKNTSNFHFETTKQFKNTTLLLALCCLIFLVFHFIQISILLSRIIAENSISLSIVIIMGLNLCFYSIFILFKFPIIYEIPSFNDLSFSSSFFQVSLGELILFIFLSLGPLSHLNSIFLLIKRKIKSDPKQNIKVPFIISALFLITLLIILFINKGLHNIMLSSNISINPKNILDLDVNSFISLIYIGILFWSFFLSVLLLIRFIKLSENTRITVFILFGFYILYLIIYYHLSTYFTYYEVLWPSLIFIYLGLQIYFKNRITGIVSIYINISIIALFSSLLINHLGQWKTEEQLIEIGQEITSKRNLMLEYHFNDWKSNIDQRFGYMDALPDVIVFDSLFKSNWIRNNFKIISDTQAINHARQNITERVANCSELYRLSPPIGAYSYFSYLNEKNAILFQNNWDQHFYGIASNQFNILNFLKFKEQLSIQVFSKDQLIYKNGNIEGAPKSTFKLSNQSEFIYQNEFSINYIHQKPRSSIQTILTIERPPWYQFIFIFSFLFIFYFILLLSAYLLSGFKLHFNFDLLSIKVPLLFILGILISVGFYAVFIYYSAKENFQKEYQEYQRKELQWVVNYLKVSSFKDEQELTLHLKNILKNEVITYNNLGTLLHSTLSDELTQDLGFDQIQGAAWFNLQDKDYFIAQRKMGTFLIDSEWIRFQLLNRDYFLQIPRAKKSFFRSNDFKSFTQSIFNVLTLLIIFSLIIGTFLARSITSSLQMISNYLSNIALGEKNKRIPIQGQGEVAQLISVYNQKVEELDASLKLINQQERSLAWKEVAQQVAHEIKNPLTPMKLSSQYLQKKLESQQEVSSELVLNYLQGQLAQIDNLVHIADHFSKFSKLPRLERKVIDLIPITSSISKAFISKNTYHIDLRSSLKEVLVFGDQGLISQVINNLLKNAIQAKKEDIPLQIDIKIYEATDFYIIDFKDNGIGMNTDTIEKIFIPNFTTKSSGSGIGLALCEQIMKEHEGSIEVSSKEGVGSIFSLKFPKIKG